ncbi:MAG TPA: 3-hydroxyacyl-CoA dehydrogenase NAD-binding domain-containing protein, partial [Planctomycetota bacterium]|nr:3-hydroxyacyl-CoA dehydrogenase NAD-binding domain-containing protein [Planctomycetota bacterium]
MTVAVDHPVAAVARVRIGDPAARATVLDAKTIETLEKTMTRIEAQLGLKGVIFTGCAPGRFLAGADLGAIEGVVDPQEGARLAARGQALFHRIARLGPITVAAIDGACLGGGLELALACRWILATDSPATRLGLPEVQLGILPGWGGTQRLPRRIGLARALDWILTGRRFDARSAERAGVVSLVVPPERLDEIAVEVADGKRELRRRPRPLAERLIEGTAPGRAVVAAAARKRVLAETHGRYPAPLRAIDVATRGLSKSLAEGLALEARALGDLIASPTSKELVRIFRLFEGAKKSADRAAADRVATAAVIGGGVMGAGIAGLLAENGIAVRLRDPRGPALVDALARFQKRIDERVRRKRLRAAEGRAALDRFQPTLGLDGVARADVVVEAIVEDLAAKKACLAEIGALVSATALVASNTSSLSVTALASAVPRPERVVGLHFFHPVERMPLVEVVRGERTSPQAVALACGIAVRLGKTPVVVADRPGFLVNRVLAPYLLEAERLVDVRGVVPRGVQDGVIGAGTTLAELEDDRDVPAALREACSLAASPQLRNMSTVGGNLLQATRCWYWRLKYPCRLHGGDVCHAREGEHREHAIFANDFCASAHPSDVAAALLALGATIRTDRRELPLADLYRLPTEEDRSMT